MIFILFISEGYVNAVYFKSQNKEMFLRGNKRMEMGLKDILENLGDVGCARHEAEIAGELYKNGQTDELIRFLKKCRCSLMDEMHESQRKVDRMDYLIRRVEKETEL